LTAVFRERSSAATEDALAASVVVHDGHDRLLRASTPPIAREHDLERSGPSRSVSAMEMNS